MCLSLLLAPSYFPSLLTNLVLVDLNTYTKKHFPLKKIVNSGINE